MTRPQPTKLKIMRGNPGQRKLNERDPSLGMKSEIPPRPGNLSCKEARNEWDRITALMKGTGILSRVDKNILALYCDTWATYREASKMVQREGYTITYSTGSVAQNPAVGVLHKARGDLIKLLQELGLTPSARSKVIGLPEEHPQESLESFLDVG